ncbi:MAG: ribonuclease P protein component [Xenococcaceae cyanobacterium MO_188.B32]|nr:ribonuclease P protein component [Xenococcaceae cyanobacterium MO_188.B32]
MGLPKENRLRDGRDFRAVYSQGLRQNSRHLVLRALLTSKLEKQFWQEPTRLGISISQKVSKKAVVRNRIKRQIRAAFRELLPIIPPGWKIVIVVRARAVECKYEHFLRELKQLLIEAKIINGY